MVERSSGARHSTQGLTMLSQQSLKGQPFSEMVELKTSEKERESQQDKCFTCQIWVKVNHEISKLFSYLSISLKLWVNVILKNIPWVGVTELES